MAANHSHNHNNQRMGLIGAGGEGADSSRAAQHPQQPAAVKSSSTCCCGSGEKLEYLDYDYTYDDTTSAKRKPQPYPRIRERGEHYIDTFNDQPWGCTFGTNEHVRGYCYCIFCFDLYKWTFQNLDIVGRISEV